MSKHSNIPAIVERLVRDGYVTLPGLASRDFMESVDHQLRPWLAVTPLCEGAFYGNKTQRVSGLLKKTPLVQSLAVHPIILAICDAILGPHADTFQINLTEAIKIHPGETAQPPHRDDDLWPCSKEHEFVLNVMWSLTPFTTTNGATNIWPKSNPDEPICATMRPGAATIFLGSTQHAGGRNVSDQASTGVVISYALGWLRTCENNFLTYPPNIVATFPQILRELVGYKIHRPILGNYEHVSPEVLISDPIPQRAYQPRDDFPDHLLKKMNDFERTQKEEFANATA